jgi:hypothetical protein
MKVHLFNHWFKHKVPIDTHFEQIKEAYFKAKTHTKVWHWLDDEHDVGQYYSNRERRNYMVFHNRQHYLMFLLKL